MNFAKRAVCCLSLSLLILLSFGLVAARAQTTSSAPAPYDEPTKSYYYPSIATTIHINKDSTIDVTEVQTFAFTGNFHAGERDVLLKKINGVTDFSVTDVTTGIPLTESHSRLNILDSSSWGKFAVWKNSDLGSESVEWYFDLQNATHTWAISYKVHGAIEFDKPYDRLYWNIFSGYDVPIDHASVSVILPDAVPASGVSETFYRTSLDAASGTQSSYANSTFTFAADSFAARDAYTIDVTWPKGIVSMQAFWWDLFYLYLPMIVMTVIILLCLLVLFLWWLVIKLRERPGNVIPQYEPPDGLRPAVAEVVATENVTSKGFAATIVDLAVRGFVRIEDDNTPGLPAASIISIIMASFFVIFVVIFGGSFAAAVAASHGSFGILSTAFGVAIFGAVLFRIVILFRSGIKKTDYRITALKDFTADTELKDYEKHYLSLIFSVGDGKSVSTKDFKKLMGMQAQDFHKQIIALRKEIGGEANIETSAFSVFHVSNGVGSHIFLAFIFLGIYFLSALSVVTWPWAIGACVVCAAATIWTIVRMARRTAQGKVLHDEWLGFKLYLEVAEKYQLQNLTPDLFEKYLPYAMIFGIEKKWAKVFERAGIVIAAPNWYGGSAGVVMAGRSSVGGAFSASAFSTSFSSSFSSAIASSVGGGSAGGAGGGGAGGGGGGGGGGAR